MENNLSIHLHPKAKQNKIEARVDKSFEIWVTAQPENDKANKACIKLLAKHLNMAPSRLEVVRGFASRLKTIKILQ